MTTRLLFTAIGVGKCRYVDHPLYLIPPFLPWIETPKLVS